MEARVKHSSETKVENWSGKAADFQAAISRGDFTRKTLLAIGFAPTGEIHMAYADAKHLTPQEKERLIPQIEPHHNCRYFGRAQLNNNVSFASDPALATMNGYEAFRGQVAHLLQTRMEASGRRTIDEVFVMPTKSTKHLREEVGIWVNGKIVNMREQTIKLDGRSETLRNLVLLPNVGMVGTVGTKVLYAPAGPNGLISDNWRTVGETTKSVAFLSRAVAGGLIATHEGEKSTQDIDITRLNVDNPQVKVGKEQVCDGIFVGALGDDSIVLMQTKGAQKALKVIPMASESAPKVTRRFREMAAATI